MSRSSPSYELRVPDSTVPNTEDPKYEIWQPPSLAEPGPSYDDIRDRADRFLQAVRSRMAINTLHDQLVWLAWMKLWATP